MRLKGLAEHHAAGCWETPARGFSRIFPDIQCLVLVSPSGAVLDKPFLITWLEKTDQALLRSTTRWHRRSATTSFSGPLPKAGEDPGENTHERRCSQHKGRAGSPRIRRAGTEGVLCPPGLPVSGKHRTSTPEGQAGAGVPSGRLGGTRPSPTQPLGSSLAQPGPPTCRSPYRQENLVREGTGASCWGPEPL